MINHILPSQKIDEIKDLTQQVHREYWSFSYERLHIVADILSWEKDGTMETVIDHLWEEAAEFLDLEDGEDILDSNLHSLPVSYKILESVLYLVNNSYYSQLIQTTLSTEKWWNITRNEVESFFIEASRYVSRLHVEHVYKNSIHFWNQQTNRDPVVLQDKTSLKDSSIPNPGYTIIPQKSEKVIDSLRIYDTKLWKQSLLKLKNSNEFWYKESRLWIDSNLEHYTVDRVSDVFIKDDHTYWYIKYLHEMPDDKFLISQSLDSALKMWKNPLKTLEKTVFEGIIELAKSSFHQTTPLLDISEQDLSEENNIADKTLWIFRFNYQTKVYDSKRLSNTKEILKNLHFLNQDSQESENSIRKKINKFLKESDLISNLYSEKFQSNLLLVKKNKLRFIYQNWTYVVHSPDYWEYETMEEASQDPLISAATHVNTVLIGILNDFYEKYRLPQSLSIQEEEIILSPLSWRH